jgi:oxygen-independent coproporphyrinogen-3 oxidase
MIVAPAGPADPVSLYIHIPFCAHICPYCDFTTYAGKQSLIPRYVDALCQEIAVAQCDRPIHSVFIGGGTPSLLESGQIARILGTCHSTFDITEDAEVTMEANPNGLDRDRLAGYREAGVGRLSIGAQTFDRRGLRTLGRQHEAADVLVALGHARDAGFDRLSLDMIFAWPGQSLERFAADLDAVLGLPEGFLTHLSLYSLIVEPGTPFADAQARGILQMPDDDASAAMYELAIARLGERGWTHYEVANWAIGDEARSVHNMQYWRNGDFFGFGAGAHGTVRGVRRMNHLLPERYCAAVEAGEPTWSNEEIIAAEIAEGETMMLGLRLLQDGVGREAFRARHGRTLDEAFGTTVADLVAIGMLVDAEGQVRLTDQGLMLANDVAERFLA